MCSPSDRKYLHIYIVSRSKYPTATVFPLRRNGSAHSLAVRANNIAEESCCTTSGEFPWLPHESHAMVEGDGRDRERTSLTLFPSPSISVLSLVTMSLVTRLSRPSRRSISPPSRWLFHRIMRTVVDLPGSKIRWRPDDMARRSIRINARKAIRNFSSETLKWRAAGFSRYSSPSSRYLDNSIAINRSVFQ